MYLLPYFEFLLGGLASLEEIRPFSRLLFVVGGGKLFCCHNIVPFVVFSQLFSQLLAIRNNTAINRTTKRLDVAMNIR
jgi:hypothetical protein